MNFCSDCGAKVSLQSVAGDDRQRYVCTDCGKTHYQSPNVLVATYICVGEKVLWIRRGIPPAVGKWAMPGGFMENDETPEAAACRELARTARGDGTKLQKLREAIFPVLAARPLRHTVHRADRRLQFGTVTAAG